MFYDERLKSPISKYNIGRIYGLDPDLNRPKAIRHGIFPIVGLLEGYQPTHYIKDGNTYRAILNEFSIEEMYVMRSVKAMDLDIKQFVSDNIDDWDGSTQYEAGSVVEHNGSFWKSLSQNTGVEPELSGDPENPSTDWESVN